MGATERAQVVIGVDTGGTFTDVFASDGTVVKVPSTRSDPALAIVSGLRAAGAGGGDALAHGTTVATNAVLEHRGARVALLTTANFEDVLAIRRQNRPSLYDLTARWPDPLVPDDRRLGVRERLDYQGHVLEPLDTEQVGGLIERVASDCMEALAVCLLFSYVDPAHEIAIADLAHRRLGAAFPLSLSHLVAPRYGEYERTSTTVLNAYVMPLMRRYLASLESRLGEFGVSRLHVMHSNGGLLSAASAAERPIQTVLSGPAAGVVGARAVAARAGEEQIITFDMGGTSTDVSVVPGDVLESSEGEVAGHPLLLPMLLIETVGAGGGSIARVDAGGGLHVGPESVGADPGPAAYGRGEQPTVTDANLVLGRLSPRGLLGGEMPLDLARAGAALERLGRALGLDAVQAAWAVVRLANSNMERAVRAVTLQRGYDPRAFTLVPFGGAGPLHAAELADDLGIRRILVPPHPGVMAALGLTVPDLQRDAYRTVLLPLGDETIPALEEACSALERLVAAEVEGEELFGEPVWSRRVDLRYVGQSFDLPVPYQPDVPAMRDAFLGAYQRRYGLSAPDQPIEVVNVRVRVSLPRLRPPRLGPDWPVEKNAEGRRDVWFGSPVGIRDLHPAESRVLRRPALASGEWAEGPAVIEQYDSTTLLTPGWKAVVDPSFNLVLERGR